MKYRIVCDSSVDLFSLPEEYSDIEFVTVPFSVYVGAKEFIDDEKLDTDLMLKENETSNERARTACPAPDAFQRAFEFDGGVLCFTISGALSGSYNSACAAKILSDEAGTSARISVFDTKGTGPKLALMAFLACDMIHEGRDFEEITAAIDEAIGKCGIAFALCSYKNLVKAGRVNKLVGLIAGHLGIWGVGIGDENGKIELRGKTTGAKRMISLMCAEIKRMGTSGGRMIISHCHNEETARKLKEQLQELFKQIRIEVIPTRGLDSYYSERRGIIVAF